MTLQQCTLPSPLGDLTLVTHDERLAGLAFADRAGSLNRSVTRRFGPTAPVAAPAPSDVARALTAYFGGDVTALDALEVDAGGTDFQQRVWRALRRIPAGRTVAYRDLARTIGAPDAVRAVGAANGANPIGIVVPCHRVIGADGALHGYAGGLDRKRWLLAHEGAIG
jgi:methylated-DNA-[protein]-cysteine S-methyltransferase